MKKLLLCLILLIVPLGANANEASENLLNNIITQIPELSQYEGFEISSNNGTTLMINFYSQTKESAQITAKSQDGTVLTYVANTISQSDKSKRIPIVSKTKASETAINFSKIVASDIFGELNTKIYTNTYNFASAGYNVRITRSVNGITYSNDSINIWIDGRTGRITRYNRIWDSDLLFTSVNQIISEKDAEDYFKKNIGLELRYNKRIQNGNVIPYLIYVPKNTGSIDAISGEPLVQRSASSNISYMEMIALYERTTIAATAIENDNAWQEGLVSSREAQIYARGISELKIDANYVAEQANYYRNTNNEYLITIKYTKAQHTISVTLNAKTLDIIGFYNSELSNKISIDTINNNRLQTVTDKFLKTYMSDYINEFSTPIINKVETADNTCIVIYERVVNGVIYKSNSAQFLINSSGEIISMSFEWDNVCFEGVSDAISVNKAYEIFFRNVGLQLGYMRTNENTALPVYSVNPQIPAIISAKSGAILSYDGTPARPRKALNYVGLKGHYAQEIATDLADYDIFASEGNVLLDVPIYQKDLIVLLATISPDGMPIYERQGSSITDEELDMVYSSFITNGIIDKDEVNPRGYVKREDAVKFLLRTVGYKGVAELEGIFKLPFEDSHEVSRGLIGYVSLARGLNLISGSEGYFYPSEYLSNADALVMIYNYLGRA